MLAFILPMRVVFPSDYRGIFVRAVIQWALLIVAGMVLSATVPD
jgi:hypothetical protein